MQDFWRYNNNFPVDQIKMRESVYLFKSGFKPVWEDRRNILGGSWTFRVPKANGSEFWDRIQLMAISEALQSVLEEGTFYTNKYRERARGGERCRSIHRNFVEAPFIFPANKRASD